MNPVEAINTLLTKASEAGQASEGEQRDLFEEFSRLLGRISNRIQDANTGLPDISVPVPAPRVQEVQAPTSNRVAPEASHLEKEEVQVQSDTPESEEHVDNKAQADEAHKEISVPEQVETAQAAAGAVKTEGEVQKEVRTTQASEEVSVPVQEQAPQFNMESPELPVETPDQAPQQSVAPGQAPSKQAQKVFEQMDQRQAPTEAAALVENPEPTIEDVLEKLLNSEGSAQARVQEVPADIDVQSGAPSKEISKLDTLSLLLSAGVLRQGPEALALKSAQTASTSAQNENRISESKAVQGAVTTSQGREAGLFKGQDAQVRSESSRASRAVPRSALLQNMEKVESALRQAASAKDGSRITVRFDPPELGTVRVDVSLKNGHLQARISSDSAQVNALLRERASEVHASLRRMGFDFDQVSVTVAGDQPVSDWQSMLNGDQSFRQQRDGRPSHGVGFMAAEAEMHSSVALDHWVA